MDWNGKRALISGASSGLGRHLALELAKGGAHLFLVGRDVERLEATKQAAIDLGASSASCYAVDLLEEDAINHLRETLLSQSPHLDLLINAVGRSDRGYLMQLDGRDLVDLFRINVVTAHQMTKLALPMLRKAQGCVINIGSLASKVATPGLGGYAVSKFGLGAMSQQLRLELEEDGVHVLLVCPGPILREDSGNRYDRVAEDRGLDEHLRKPGGGASLKRLDPEKLSREILAAAAERRIDLIRPSKVRWLIGIGSLWPRLGDWILKRSIQKNR